MDNNKKIIREFFNNFGNQVVVETGKPVDVTIHTYLCDWCESILRAAIDIRKNPASLDTSGEIVAGHNFTGNLINSICVVLYEKSKGKKTSFFADSTGLKPAIRRELSYVTYKGRKRRNRIYFRPGSRFGSADWSGSISHINAESLIPTDESYGYSDARKFASSWVPRSTSADFVICVAYTSEYADFVEQQRHTTGFMETMMFTHRTAIEWVGLKKVA